MTFKFSNKIIFLFTLVISSMLSLSRVQGFLHNIRKASLPSGNFLRYKGGHLNNQIFFSHHKKEIHGPKIMPVTVLSGFLGAGKTTFLNNLLNNKKGIKFGLIVNDMASVNVDAKQVRSQNIGSSDGVDTLELQNGCICCSLAEDLMMSLAKLVETAEEKNIHYDHIIIECSGIAEPRRIRDFFQFAADNKIELLEKTKLDTLITVVDAESFYKYFGTDSDIASNPSLAYPDSTGVQDQEGAKRKITELLLEQVECSDIILINKIDLVNEKQIDVVKKVVSSINPIGHIFNCIRGEVENPFKLVGSANGLGAANWGIIDEHKKLIKHAEEQEKHIHSKDCDDITCKDPTHNHDHSHSHDSCHHKCSDPSHNHSHNHDHHKEHNCNSQDHGNSCNSESCRHDHDHNQKCLDPSHDISHDHGKHCHDNSHAHTHNHSHDHSHEQKNYDMTTAEQRFGITSFVYKRRKPFHPQRLTNFLRSLGKLSFKGISSIPEVLDLKDQHDLKDASRSLLRSKGFIWMGTSKSGAYFISHAGQYLELSVLGKWWADLDRSEWPENMEIDIMNDFDGPHGDRRQEIVFIGLFGDPKARKAIEYGLDACLLNSEEMKEYEKLSKQGDHALHNYFYPK